MLLLDQSFEVSDQIRALGRAFMLVTALRLFEVISFGKLFNFVFVRLFEDWLVLMSTRRLMWTHRVRTKRD